MLRAGHRVTVWNPTSAKAEPLVREGAGRRATVIVTSGDSGYEPGGPLWPMNHVEPHLRAIFEFIGVSDLRFVYAGNDEFGGERLQRSLESAARLVAEEAASTVNLVECGS
ncbi:MAG: NAD(P)H-dependent oxidoreductase [Chromatiales bacterium]